jgi:hypothetical protein
MANVLQASSYAVHASAQAHLVFCHGNTRQQASISSTGVETHTVRQSSTACMQRLGHGEESKQGMQSLAAC